MSNLLAFLRLQSGMEKNQSVERRLQPHSSIPVKDAINANPQQNMQPNVSPRSVRPTLAATRFLATCSFLASFVIAGLLAIFSIQQVHSSQWLSCLCVCVSWVIWEDCKGAVQGFSSMDDCPAGFSMSTFSHRSCDFPMAYKVLKSPGTENVFGQSYTASGQYCRNCRLWDFRGCRQHFLAELETQPIVKEHETDPFMKLRLWVCRECSTLQRMAPVAFRVVWWWSKTLTAVNHQESK